MNRWLRRRCWRRWRPELVSGRYEHANIFIELDRISNSILSLDDRIRVISQTRIGIREGPVADAFVPFAELKHTTVATTVAREMVRLSLRFDCLIVVVVVCAKFVVCVICNWLCWWAVDAIGRVQAYVVRIEVIVEDFAVVVIVDLDEFGVDFFQARFELTFGEIVGCRCET